MCNLKFLREIYGDCESKGGFCRGKYVLLEYFFVEPIACYGTPVVVMSANNFSF